MLLLEKKTMPKINIILVHSCKRFVYFHFGALELHPTPPLSFSRLDLGIYSVNLKCWVLVPDQSDLIQLF